MKFKIKKKFTILVALVAIFLVVAAIWYYKERSFSKAVLKLEILSSDTVQTGDEIQYTVRYKNNSNFTLSQPKLTFEYPEYTINEENKTRVSKDLKDIYPGDEEFVQFKGRLLGKEGDLKVAKVLLSYIPQNLKARYESTTTFTTKIGTVPVSLDFDLPTKVEKGRSLQFSINYFSNLDYALSGLKLNVEYPTNFTFESSDPKSLDKNQWDIALLDKAQGGRVKITGTFAGQTGDKMQFKSQLGVWKDGEFILLKETTKDIEVIEPLIYISQLINGSANYVASPGETLHYQIYFRNIGSSTFSNLFLVNKFDTDVFDLTTLSVDYGQAQPESNMVVWDWKQVPSLKSLDPQEEGEVSFSVKLKCCQTPNPEDFNNIYAINEVNIAQINQQFQTKVNSKLVILQRGLYQDPTLGNSGPVPPVAGQATTYTVVWQVKDFFNTVKNVKVKAILAPGVSLTGKIIPDTAISSFSLDSQTRQVVWNVADTMEPGTGVLNAPPSIMFQVSLTPTDAQKGKILTIINQATVSAEDQWTGKNIESTYPAIDTTIPDDSAVVNHSGVVQ